MSEQIITVGSLINRYRLEEELGGSEIARVFRAEDTRLSREVALKLVTHSLDYSSAFMDNFMKEARALGRLTHPNIARVLDFGQDQGYLYLVSEFVQGESLEDRLAKGQPQDWHEVVEMLIPITEALESAHQAGIIHRGLKPSNILITPDGRPMMTDFSIARILEAEETREMTGTHVGLGSPFYMSPEQGKGLNVDDRADIYALGTIFFEWITGHKPFAGGSSMEIVIQQVSTPPPLPSQFLPDLPQAVEKIILTMMCKDRDERFQTMVEVTEALREVLSSGEFSGRARAKKPRRKVWAAVVIGLLVVAGLGIGGAWLTKIGPFAPAPQPTAVALRPSPQPSASPTARPSPTVTPSTKAAVVELTPVVTATPTATSMPELAYEYPQLPVLERTTVPQGTEKIEPENAAQVVELARWGSAPARAIAWSQDDKHIYAATMAGLYAYDADLLTPARFFDAGGALTALAVSDDNNRMATGDENGMVRLWNPLTAELIAELPGHTGAIIALDFSLTGDRLVSASKDRTARLWDGNGKPIATLTRHGLPVTGAVFLKGDKELITVSEDFKLIRWDSITGEKTGETTSQTRLLDMVVGENTGQVMVASSGPAVELWDLSEKQGKLLSSIKEDQSGTLIQALAFSPNYTLVATASGDGQVRVWNPGGLLLWSLQAEEPAAGQKASPLIDVSFSHDATRLAGLAQNGTIVIWELSTRNQIAKYVANVQPVAGLTSAWDNSELVTQYADGMSQWRPMADGTPGRIFAGKLPTGTTSAQIALTNNLVAVARTNSAGEKVLALEKSSAPEDRSLVGYSEGGIRFLDNKLMLAVGSNRAINFWSLNSDYRILATRYAYAGNCQVAYDFEDHFLAAGSDLGVFVNEDTMPFFCKLTKVPYTLDWSYVEGGHTMAYALSTGQMALLTAKPDGSPVTQHIAVEGGVVQAVAISPDEHLLATGSADGKVRIWDLASQKMLAVIGHHTRAVTDLIFSLDGTKLISGAADGTMEVWGLFNK